MAHVGGSFFDQISESVFGQFQGTLAAWIPGRTGEDSFQEEPLVDLLEAWLIHRQQREPDAADTQILFGIHAAGRGATWASQPAVSWPGGQGGWAGQPGGLRHSWPGQPASPAGQRLASKGRSCWLVGLASLRARAPA